VTKITSFERKCTGFDQKVTDFEANLKTPFKNKDL
jgi:hypothetical protein